MTAEEMRHGGDASSGCDVAADAVPAITEPGAPAPEGTLMDLLLSMPDVGDDAVFERPVEYKRKPPAWDT